MITFAEKDQPKEICGVLFEKNETSYSVIPISNVSPIPTKSFMMSPEELLNIFYQVEQENLTIQAFFHSHPFSEPVPSQTDLAQAFYPQIPMIIIGKQNQTWELRAFYLEKETYIQIPVKIFHLSK
jgi:proteasome lid subunit RPN8/RPN11